MRSDGYLSRETLSSIFDWRTAITSQLEKCNAFAELHRAQSAWVIPNPWDVGSAKVLEGLGFKALATTSSGFAYTLGRADGEVSLEEKLQHCRMLAAATSIPLNADFENGFADDPEEVARNLTRLAETGIAGCSIEDYSRDDHVLYDFELAVERVQAAATAITALNLPIQLTARAENLIRGVDDIDDTIRRLQAFEAAGADVLYAPGVRTLEQLKQITAALDKPFNVLASTLPGASIEQFTQAGATRISVGGALNYAAVNPLLTAGKEMLEAGTFDWLNDLARGQEIRKLLA